MRMIFYLWKERKVASFYFCIRDYLCSLYFPSSVWVFSFISLIISSLAVIDLIGNDYKNWIFSNTANYRTNTCVERDRKRSESWGHMTRPFRVRNLTGYFVMGSHLWVTFPGILHCLIYQNTFVQWLLWTLSLPLARSLATKKHGKFCCKWRTIYFCHCKLLKFAKLFIFKA